MLVVLKRLAILFAYITIRCAGAGSHRASHPVSQSLTRPGLVPPALLFSFWRLDILAGGSTTFDTGYAAYLSMLMLDHTNKCAQCSANELPLAVCQ